WSHLTRAVRHRHACRLLEPFPERSHPLRPLVHPYYARAARHYQCAVGVGLDVPRLLDGDGVLQLAGFRAPDLDQVFAGEAEIEESVARVDAAEPGRVRALRLVHIGADHNKISAALLLGPGRGAAIELEADHARAVLPAVGPAPAGLCEVNVPVVGGQRHRVIRQARVRAPAPQLAPVEVRAD